MSRAERRQQQAQIALEHAEDQQQRPNIPPKPLTDTDRCPAALGKRHSFGMRGNDGIFRCWYCCQPRP